MGEISETPAGTVRRVLYLVAPFLFPRTYGSLLYVWFSFPLGLLYFVGLTVGLLVGGALTLVWIGLLLVLATLLAAWVAEGLERQLANVLLGARVPARREVPPPGASRRGWFGHVFFGPALWKGLLFLMLKFPLGLVGWVASVIGLAVSLSLLAVPVLYLIDPSAGHGQVDIPGWFFGSFDSLADVLPWGVVGLIGLIATLHLHNALGWLWARLAEHLLGARLPEAGTGGVEEEPSALAVA
ncbi:MAG: sensor domain-containing protein [Holophagales bacterium]|nr:sensor domain-containing protein [Holophagales bacterium]